VDRAQLIQKLESMPEVIHRAELELLKAAEDTRQAKLALDMREGALILEEGLINGKNAEQRRAQLDSHTIEERNALVTAQQVEASARAMLTRQQNEFAAYRAMARLLAEEVA
jgi:hypothetical protein